MATKQPPKSRRPGKASATTARADVSAAEIRQRIEEAAYYKAKQRGFAPGHELDDWIAAEAEVRRRLER
jgi:hypothetical protein